MRYALFCLAGALACPAYAQTVENSPRPPEHRPVVNLASDKGLTVWIEGFQTRAVQAGISTAVFDRALNDITYDKKVVERDRNQSEFTKTIWDYLATAVSDLRISNGKAALARQSTALLAIEDEYGVPKEIVTAIWGLESAYGTFRGSESVVRSMASLAYDARRAEFFEEQLLAALRILQSGDTTADQMKGSWAGAMGHTQFMPGSYLEHAVDWTGDGRRDIWGDDPQDALASTAAYLKANGWITGQPWGVEVQIPDGFDYLLASREITKSPQDWAALGVMDMNGVPVVDAGAASILLPAGAKGAAFMIFDNFAVLESYNTADAYVIGVGHLADRIAGRAAIKSGWPVSDRALTKPERIELQERLTALGFDTQKIDAKIGPLTINAVREWQVARGLVPDGYAAPSVLEALRLE